MATIKEIQSRNICYVTRANLRVRPRFFDQAEISTFSLNNVIVRLIKIMNRADKNWAHF